MNLSQQVNCEVGAYSSRELQGLQAHPLVGSVNHTGARRRVGVVETEAVALHPQRTQELEIRLPGMISGTSAAPGISIRTARSIAATKPDSTGLEPPPLSPYVKTISPGSRGQPPASETA